MSILFSLKILFVSLRFPIFTMNKAIAAVLVIAIVAGVFVLDGNALLRAGRDRIERFKQAMEHQREAPAAKRETPICWPGPAPGKFSVGNSDFSRNRGREAS